MPTMRRARKRVALLLLGILLGSASGAAEEPGTRPFVRPAGVLLGPFEKYSDCEQVPYAGPQTRLYSDRPYHTRASVASLEGHRFCRSQRHGHDLWLIEVLRDTTLFTLASARHDLEASGWERVDEPVFVAAAAVSLDRLYRNRVGPGGYAIHYGHARTAVPVFWRPADVRVLQRPVFDQ